MALNGLMWATEEVAEQQYQTIWREHGLQRYYSINNIMEHWTRSLRVRDDDIHFTSHSYQSFYRQICPEAYLRPQYQVHVRYTNDKSDVDLSTASTFDNQKAVNNPLS